MHRKNFPSLDSQTAEIDGICLRLSHPHEVLGKWIGQAEILHQLLACWVVVDERDLPLSPRLVGPPGIGKTALGMAVRRYGISSCTSTNARRTHARRISW